MLKRLAISVCAVLLVGLLSQGAHADQSIGRTSNCINKAACGTADERDAGETSAPEVNMLPPEYIDPSMPTRTESGAKHLYPFGEPSQSDPVADHRDCVNVVTGAVRGNEAEANRLCRERN